MPQREPALLWLRDCALTALDLALCTLTSWVFFRLDFVSSNYILTYILGVMYINVFTSVSYTHLMPSALSGASAACRLHLSVRNAQNKNSTASAAKMQSRCV